jgi:conjugal transfer ATP-binding protein TraC
MNRVFSRNQQGGRAQRAGSFEAPSGDTAGLVPVSRVLPDMVVTKSGAFVKMYELPPVPPDMERESSGAFQQKFANILASLPPRIKFQLTVIPAPIDPSPDLEHFYQLQQYWSSQPESDQFNTGYLNNAGLEHATRSYMALITNWFGSLTPISSRMILSISYVPLMQQNRGFFGLGRTGGSNRSALETYAGKAREHFADQGGLLQQAFINQGLNLVPLSGPEMAQVVWRVLHPTTAGAHETSADAALQNVLEKGRGGKAYSYPDHRAFSPDLAPDRVIDALAPDNVREEPELLYIDGVYLRGYSIIDYNPGSVVHLRQLEGLPGGFFGSLFIEIEDPAQIAGKLRSKETSLKGLSHLRQSKGIISNYTKDQEVGEVEKTRAMMEMGLENPITIRFYIMVAAPDLAELQNRSRMLENILTTLGVKFFATTHNQLPTWKTIMPLTHMAFQQRKRNMTPGSLQSFFWHPKGRLFEESGRYMGFDINSGTPLFYDPLGPSKDRSPTILSIGKTGAGKSVWLRSNMLIGLMKGNTVFAIDLEGEMREFVKAYGGRYVTIGTGDSDRLNVLDVHPGEEEPLVAGIEQLVVFVSTVLQRQINHGEEWNLLSEAYEEAVKGRAGSLDAESWSRINSPVLRDITDILEHMGEAGRSLAAGLKPYATGVYSQFFGSQSTLDIVDEKLVVFGLSDVRSSSSAEVRLSAYLWQVMSIIWSETVRRHRENPNHVTDVFLDEVWALLRAPGGGEAIENMARRYRKRNGVLWMATQEVDEFLHSQVGQRILKVVGVTALMSQTDYAASELQRLLRLSDLIRNSLVDLPTGKLVLKLPMGTKIVRTLVPEDVNGVL